MTHERLAEIKARAEAATPGPRRVTTDGGHVELNPSEGDYAYIPCESRDAAHIAHSRQDILDLVAEVERLQRLLEKNEPVMTAAMYFVFNDRTFTGANRLADAVYGLNRRKPD